MDIDHFNCYRIVIKLFIYFNLFKVIFEFIPNVD